MGAGAIGQEVIACGVADEALTSTTTIQTTSKSTLLAQSCGITLEEVPFFMALSAFLQTQVGEAVAEEALLTSLGGRVQEIASG